MKQETTISFKLTKREKELIVLIADGCTDLIMGTKLNISKNTVSTHRKKLLRKLEVKNTAQLVKKACLMGLIN